eukprot:CAMPEP_0194240892 /NCGR_PEP_ID=MMETSP0158-20130606/6936_1 /TAXON_ID=33649 /ORGANISM="Thalassionema nitzschioides, Strain L26-B" /LENGTH=836 /DNA_ID=CAMNT_0038975691 /DNA_START=243 /DNA_END=2753 /DNA_ORIENTATION=+
MTTDYAPRKRTKSDYGDDCDLEEQHSKDKHSSSGKASRKWHRHDCHVTIVSILLLIPLFVLLSVENTSQLAAALGSLTEHELSYRMLLSEAVPSLEECKHPLRMAVPLLVSEQVYASKQPSVPTLAMSSKKKQPRVCIVVTTFNVVDYVGEAVDSVLKQTYQNLEIIVVDDNSSDGTADFLLEKYATAPPGPDTSKPTLQVVRLTHNTNGGAGQPSNIGMDSCSDYTDYVMFADGDDYMEHDAVEEMLTHAETFNSDVVMADFDVVMPLPNGNVISEPSYDLQHWSEIPADIPFNIITHPRVLRTSPVPWRKMYRRKMLLKYNVKFPEGDYFYEDNGFHWSTLNSAGRCSKIDRVLFHHRRARKGQTSFNFNQADGEAVVMSMEWFQQYTSLAKIGGYFPNVHRIGRHLFPETSDTQRQGIDCLPPVAPIEVATTYYQFLIASAWIGKKQITRQMREKFFRRLDQVRHHWTGQDNVVVPKGYWQSLNETANINKAARPKQVDLSIIMPTVNVADFIYDLLDSMYAQLFRPGFTFEIFVIDDGSTDDTANILRDFADDHKHNFYFMSTGKSNGAGRARNLAIPLIEGRYVYFVDADDGYDFSALAEAVIFATENKKDLMLMPYSVEYVGPDSRNTKEGMMKSDDRIWTQILEKEPSHLEQKEAALALINYPWKQLTSSKLMFDADVFFGPTKVHNDVQFHWMSIGASQNLHFYDKVICTHRIFDSSVRGQLTKVKDSARMTVFPALGMTQRALAKNGNFDGEEGEKIAFPQWRKFTKGLLKWAKGRVPDDLKESYDRQADHLLQVLDRNSTDPGELRTWAYWGDRFAPVPKRISEIV